MIFERIKADQVQARKDRDKAKAASLTDFIGKVENVMLTKGGATANTDPEVIQRIKGLLSLYEGQIMEHGQRSEWQYEIDLWTSYLPAMPTESELRAIIEPMKADGKGIGDVMKEMKSRFGTAVDNKLASQIYRES